MSQFTLEISFSIEPVVHERIVDGLSVLLEKNRVGELIESKHTQNGSVFAISTRKDVDDLSARIIIEEILDNEQINGLVSLSKGFEVPVFIRGDISPADPVHDSIIGSFTNLESQTHHIIRTCLYCRNFSIKPVGSGADLLAQCARKMDGGAFSDPLPMTHRPNESLILLREMVFFADKCSLFQQD